MLDGFIGLLLVLSVWVVLVGWSSGEGMHARSMCFGAKLAKRWSRLIVWETGMAMSLQRGTSAGVGSLLKTVSKLARKAMSSVVVAGDCSVAMKLFRILRRSW